MAQAPSDAPFKAHGVTVKPNWDWSAQYRAEVADELRNATRGDLSPEEVEHRYIVWYAQEHGLGLAEARLRIKSGI